MVRGKSRILAVLLVMMLMLSELAVSFGYASGEDDSGPASSNGDTCSHWFEDDTFSREETEILNPYRDNGNGTCSQLKYVKTLYKCSNCNEEYLRSEDWIIIDTKDHVYAEGNCIYCLGANHVHDWSDHNGICKAIIHTDDQGDIQCGMLCPHISWNNGSCTVCGWQCPHTDYINGVCEKCGNPCPNHNWSQGQCTICNVVCDHNWVNNGTTHKCTICDRTEPHYITDGSAPNCTVCGGQCSHEWNAQGMCIYCYAWCEHDWDISAASHTCKTCGYTSMHSFNGTSTCDTCGYECQHPNKTTSGYLMNGQAAYAQISGDNQYHNVTGNLHLDISCPDCDYQESKDNVQGTIKEQHSYNDNGVCCLCGYENTCTHPTTKVEDLQFDYSNTSIAGCNESTHTLSGYNVIRTVCTVCGQTVSEQRGESATVTEDHYMAPEGYCYVCGYGCRHENYDWYDDISELVYTDIDADKHHLEGPLYQVKQCLTCNQILSREKSEDMNLDEPHWYRNGVCMGCGRKSNCNHPSTVTEGWFTEEPEIEAIDDEYHLLRGKHVTGISCAVCGEPLSEGPEEYTEIKEKHDAYSRYEFVVCDTCGHICTHSKIHDIDDPNEGIFKVESFKQKDEKAHYAIGKLYAAAECDYCAAYMEGSLLSENATEEWDHYFAADGRCIECGFCQHKQTETKEEDAWTDWADAKDGKNHGRIHSHTTIVTCKICGEEISRETKVETETEAHKEENGKCTVCAYVYPTPTPAPTPEPTPEPEQIPALTPAPVQMTDEELANEISDLLMQDALAIEADIDIQTNDNGTKTVVISPEEKKTDSETVNSTLTLTLPDKMLTTLSEQNVTDVKLQSGANNTEIKLDIAETAEKLAEHAGGQLIVEIEENAEIAEQVMTNISEKYITVSNTATTVRIQIDVDGEKHDVNAAKVTIRMETEYQEGMKILYIDAEGNATETEAVWIPATDIEPGHWDVPFIGNGQYIPVMPKE